MADNTILKGMWCFNNTIDTTERTLTFNYSCNINGELIECRDIQINQYGSVWYNYADYSNGANVYSSGKWYGEGNKTIVVAEGQEDKTDVLAFLQANANKVNWDVVYSTPEDYLYSIASLQQGMSDMLVNQGGTKPQYASIEQYATSLIDLRKEFTKLLNSYGVSASESEKMGVVWANKFRAVINNYINDNVVDLYDDTTKKLNAGAFAFRTNLKTVEMNVVEELEDAVFWIPYSSSENIYRYRLTSVKMPKLSKTTQTYEYYTYGAFENNINLTTFEAPLLQNVAAQMFKNCKKIDNLYFPECTFIDGNAFDGCKNLKNIYIPKVQTVGIYGFQNCTALEEIEIPECTKIQFYGFYNCTSLKIILAPKLEIIDIYCFENCTSLEEIDFSNVINLGDSCFKNSGLTGEINVPNATQVANNVFWGTKITKLSLPILETLTNFYPASSLADGCTLLEEVYLPKMTNKDNKGLMYAFRNCTSLKVVYMPLLQIVAAYMFQGCTSLEEIDLPSVIECKSRCFENCTALKTIKLNSMTKFDASFIQGVTSLTTFEAKSITNLQTFNLFYNRKLLQSANIGKISTIQAYTFQNCTALTDVYLGYDGVVSLSNVAAFSGAGTTQGYVNIHVKPDYADSYATATNWSSVIAGGTIVIVGDYSD